MKSHVSSSDIEAVRNAVNAAYEALDDSAYRLLDAAPSSPLGRAYKQTLNLRGKLTALSTILQEEKENARW